MVGLDSISLTTWAINSEVARHQTSQKGNIRASVPLQPPTAPRATPFSYTLEKLPLTHIKGIDRPLCYHKTRDFTTDRFFQFRSQEDMDVPSIVNLFATSLNPDPNVRKVSEIEIRRVS